MQNEKYCHKVVCGNIVGVFPRDKGELRRWYNKCKETARACTYDGKLDWFAASRTIPYVRLWQDNLFGTYYARNERDILFHENNDPEDTLILSDIAYYYWALNENKWRIVVEKFKSIYPNMSEEQIWNEARANIINEELQNYGVITYQSARIWACTDELVREVEFKFNRIGFRDMYMRRNNNIAAVPVNHTVAAFTEPEMVNPTMLNDRYFQEIPKNNQESAEIDFNKLFDNQSIPEINPEMDGWIRCIDTHPNQYGTYNYTNTLNDWQNQQRLYAEQNAMAYNQFMNPYQNRVYVPQQPPPSPGFSNVVSTPNPFYPSTPQQTSQQPKYNVATKDEAVNKILENNSGYKKEEDGTETLDLAKMFGAAPQQPKEKLSDDLAEASKLMASTMKNGDKIIKDINNQQAQQQPQQMPMMGFNPLFYQNSTMQNVYNSSPIVNRNEDGSYRYEDEPQGAKPGDKYLIPTREEIESGKCFYSYVVKNGVSFKDPTLKLPKRKKEGRKNKPFRSCVVIGDKFYGDPEVIESIKNQMEQDQKIEAALDYKDAAEKIQNMDRETELFLLINTLKKYNKYMADQLAFMKDDHSVSAEDFADMLDQSLQLLEGYQKQDPLASVKAPGVRVENKKLIIDKTQKNVQDAMERVVNIQKIRDNKFSTIQEAMKETGMTASEIQTVMKYRPVDPNELLSGKVKAQEYQGMQIQNNIVEQMQIPQDGKEIKFEDLDKNKQLIYQLQALTNLRVVHSEEEYNRVKEWESRTHQLTPYQNNRKNIYLFWKRIMRNIDDTKDLSDQEYATWFDKWWNEPSNINNGGVYNPSMYTKTKSRAELRSMESERRSNNLKHAQAVTPLIEQSESNFMKQKIGQIIQNTKIEGKNLYDFVYGAGFSTLCYNNLQERFKAQQNNVRRMFNVPALRQNMMNGTYATPSFNATPQQYTTLMNSDKYNDRRQRFINKIFSKEEMRPTAKRYFYE